jgi:hypothetical protein
VHFLEACVPFRRIFRAPWGLSVAKSSALPVVAAKIDEDQPSGDVALQKEVKVHESVRVLVVGSQPAEQLLWSSSTCAFASTSTYSTPEFVSSTDRIPVRNVAALRPELHPSGLDIRG